MNCDARFTQSGHFGLGANYWASHAATDMWKDWRMDVMEGDLAALAAHGSQVLRVFPIWPDFQPITRLYKGDGTPQEYRLGEEELPDTEAGRAGMSEAMMGRFEQFADLAQRHGQKLIVALLTGQMTDRLFMPPGLAGMNPITDPEALVWEVRFVRYFVRRMAKHPAIAAWNFGNECNCMGKAPSPAAASHWMASIANAVRLEDPARPIISGMNGNALVSREGSASPGHHHWSVAAQAEHCDVLTSHYYHMWKSTATDASATLKAVLMPVAENRLFGDVGGRPCFMEETGMWRGSNADLETLASHLRGILWNLLASDGGGLLWWCAFDQDTIRLPPYDWEMAGLEHGLFSAASEPRATAGELLSFRKFLDSLPFPALPAAPAEAVCLVGHSQQDHSKIASGAFILARQAGLNLTFQEGRQKLKEAALYLIPSAIGKAGLSAANWEELRRRVKEGATLYLSMDEVYVDHLAEVFSAEVHGRFADPRGGKYTFHLPEGDFDFALPSRMTTELRGLGAGALAQDGAGRPDFFSAAYGKGRVFLLGFPLERLMMDAPSAFQSPQGSHAWKIYRHIAREAMAGRIVGKEDPLLTLTEHPVGEGERLVLVVNNRPEKTRARLEVSAGWTHGETYPSSAAGKGEGVGVHVEMGPNAGAILRFKRGPR